MGLSIEFPNNDIRCEDVRVLIKIQSLALKEVGMQNSYLKILVIMIESSSMAWRMRLPGNGQINKWNGFKIMKSMCLDKNIYLIFHC